MYARRFACFSNALGSGSDAPLGWWAQAILGVARYRNEANDPDLARDCYLWKARVNVLVRHRGRL